MADLTLPEVASEMWTDQTETESGFVNTTASWLL